MKKARCSEQKLFCVQSSEKEIRPPLYSTRKNHKNMIKNHIKTAILIFSAAFFVFACASASAQGTQSNSPSGNYGLDETVSVTSGGFSAKEALLDPAANKPQILVGKIIGVVLSFVGVIFLVLIIYSGLTWMLAQGNESTIDKAKQTIIAATTGLVIVMAAYAITAFIGNQLSNTK